MDIMTNEEWAELVREQQALIKRQDEENSTLHSKLAAETLRADQGWARYDEANRDRISARTALAEAQGRIGGFILAKAEAEARAYQLADLHVAQGIAGAVVPAQTGIIESLETSEGEARQFLNQAGGQVKDAGVSLPLSWNTAKENLIQQAQLWAMEARTQRSTVLDILRHFGCAEEDWHALELIKAALAAPQQHAQAAQPKCATCNGSGVVGTPGAPCQFCSTPSAKALSEAIGNAQTAQPSREWYERMAKAEIEADVNIEAGNTQAALSDRLPPLPDDMDPSKRIVLSSIDSVEFSELMGAYASAPNMDTAWAVLHYADKRMHAIMAERFALATCQPAPVAAAVQGGIVPPVWISELCGPEVDDLSYGQGFRNGFNQCRDVVLESIAAQPAADAAPDMFKEAYMEWSRKTDWVQEQIGTFPIHSLEMHRADVMREEINRLRASPLFQQGRAAGIEEAAKLLDPKNASDDWTPVAQTKAHYAGEIRALNNQGG